MKKILQLRLIRAKWAMAVSVVIGLLVAPHAAFATGSATLYTSPGGTQSVSLNSTFSLQVRINATVSPGAAEVYISYPTAKLQVQSIDYSGSPYTIQLLESNSGGVLEMDRAAFSAIPAGDQLFATVNFKAIASGSAPISFTNSSVVRAFSDSSAMALTKNGVTYNITTPTPPPPPPVTPPTPTPTPTPSPAPSPNPTPSPTSHPSTTPPSSTTKTTTKSPSPTPTPSPSPSGTPSPAPATDTTSGSNDQASSGGQTLDVHIIDKTNKPVQGAKVTIDGTNISTGSDGVAHFNSVTPGDKQVAVDYKGKKSTQNTQVLGASTADTPEAVTLQIDSSKSNPLIFILPVTLIAILVGLFVLARPLLGKLRHGNYPQESHDPMGMLSNMDAAGGPAPGSVVAPGSVSPTPTPPPYIPPVSSSPPPSPPANPLPPPPPST